MVEFLLIIKFAVGFILVGVSYFAVFVLGFCAHSKLVKYMTEEKVGEGEDE